MSTKKVIDYIVVKRTDQDVSFLERLDSEVKQVETSIQTKEKSILEIEPKIAHYENLRKEFERFKCLEIGKTYDKKEEFGLQKWIGGLKFQHPLGYNHPGEREKIISPLDMKNIHEKYVEIDKILKELVETNDSNIVALSNLKSKLDALQNNPDACTNTMLRSRFENDIITLLNKGYVLQGGVSASRGTLSQAMVKYEQ